MRQSVVSKRICLRLLIFVCAFFITGCGTSEKKDEQKAEVNAEIVESDNCNANISDFERRMDEKGWDYQYLKSDATIIVATMDEIDRELAQEIIESHVYEYVSSMGIAFRVTDCDEYVYVEGIKN